MSKVPLTQGKGDRRRAQVISDVEMAANWERIFGSRRESRHESTDPIEINDNLPDPETNLPDAGPTV